LRAELPPRTDLLVAGDGPVVVVGGTLLAAKFQPDTRGLDAAAVGLMLLSAAPLAWRPRAPVPVLVVVAVAEYLVIGYAYGPVQLCMVFAMFEVARQHGLRTSLAACAVAVAAISAAVLTGAGANKPRIVAAANAVRELAGGPVVGRCAGARPGGGRRPGPVVSCWHGVRWRSGCGWRRRCTTWPGTGSPPWRCRRGAGRRPVGGADGPAGARGPRARHVGGRRSWRRPGGTRPRPGDDFSGAGMGCRGHLSRAVVLDGGGQGPDGGRGTWPRLTPRYTDMTGTARARDPRTLDPSAGTPAVVVPHRSRQQSVEIHPRASPFIVGPNR
jgi:hypothetical protein